MSLPVDLLKLGVNGCGMMCVNRKGCPDGLQAVAKKGRGQSKTWQSGNFTVSVWQDSKPVVVAASNSDPLAKMSVTRKQKDGTRINVAAPMSVVQYNKYYMEGSIKMTNCESTIMYDLSLGNITNTFFGLCLRWQ